MNKPIFTTAFAPFLAAVLACTGALAGAAPLAQTMYVRGAFNGWGVDNPLLAQAGGIYQADILVSPGNHAFKLGSKDWQAEWVADPNASVAVKPDTDIALAPHAGPEDFLFVRQAGFYRFRLDTTGAVPGLRISRVGEAPASTEDPHRGHTAEQTLAFATWDGKTERARFSALDAGAPLRDYAQSSTMQLRDPGPSFVRVREAPGLPLSRTGSLAFDALFALAVAEMREDSVSAIRDGSYNGGAAIDCDCFETGEKWHYVWTRDLSYAADLGLALLDPERVMRSLEFKLSGYRAGVVRPAAVAGTDDGLQIIQDTGTGGSWPVSTDRVAWAFGADKVLPLLAPGERARFAARALAALKNTLDNDRIAAFDPADGLYRGEASFLDWRDQSYAGWITTDLASLASAKALSTNVAHYKALTLAATLAGAAGQGARAATYRSWAAALKAAINRRFWLEDEGLYASLTAGHLDGAPLHKFDWLGQSLAVITGVADARQARAIMAHYPHGPMGAPVIYPQQPGRPVYHNRALWPFVTAYGLKAAIATGNVSAADAAYASLVRGAALNLSNMENLEWLSGQPLLLDEQQPQLIGPVINSRRQLWSVGAYLGMVIEDVFGVHAQADGIRVAPFITARLRRDSFGSSDRIALRGLRLRGKLIDVTIALPRALPRADTGSSDGVYEVAAVTVNGKAAPDLLAWDALPALSHIAVRLGRLQPGQQQLRRVGADPYLETPAVFAPPAPVLDFTAGALSLADPSAAVRYQWYRDGAAIGALPAAAATAQAAGHARGCYAAEAIYRASGNRSHHSQSVCLGEQRQLAWDGAGALAVDVDASGSYQLQLRYRNEANQINLGISSAVKVLTVADAAGATVARAVVVMPHTRPGGQVPAFYSTPVPALLRAGSYHVRLDDFYNMSYLDANRSFSGAGGTTGPANSAAIAALRILHVNPPSPPLTTASP